MREEILFNDDWLFHKGDIERPLPTVKGPIYTSSKTERMKWGPACIQYNDAHDDFSLDVEYSCDRWDSVMLPHDYIIEGTPSKDQNNALGFFKYENAWYRKHFTLSEADRNKRITLVFDGIASIATVYLNGCLLKHNYCGYTSFEVDLTDYVNFGDEGENVLAVYVQTNGHEGWWYEGGGIYRHVHLKKTNLVAVDLWGVYVAPQKNDDNSFTIDVETTIVNQSIKDVTAIAQSYIKDKDGNIVVSAQGEIDVSAKYKAVAKYSTVLDNPVLWDLDNPYQYSMHTEILVNDEVVDTYDTRFGCRYFEIDPNKGFFLNGKYVKIKGVCGHQDFGLTGKAVPDNINRYKMQMLKQMGANGYRTSHYSQTESIMDALDDLGFIVFAETRWFESTDEGLQQLDMVIRRDRNRPSIFIWSLGNEEPCHLNEMGKRINQTMMAYAKRLDKYRPMTSAISHDPEKVTICDDIDVIGVNYNHLSYDDLHKQYPNKAIFSSECCATGATRGWYFDDDDNRAYLGAYDKDTNDWFTGREKLWKMVMAREWLFGAYQWIAFEHRGEAAWPRICSQSGAIDLFLQKKDAFYQNQSHWIDSPMVHLLPHWNWLGREGEEIKVCAYTNCEELELFLNKKSLGRKTIERWGHGEWMVKYTPGELYVVAYNNEEEVVKDVQVTTGKPVKLMMKLDNETPKANNNDIALITCYCVDENGAMVPDASPFVKFNSNNIGVIVGTGSDISDHTPVSCPDRKMRAGLISVAVKLKNTAGLLKVYAQADDLTMGCITVEV